MERKKIIYEDLYKTFSILYVLYILYIFNQNEKINKALYHLLLNKSKR